MAHGKEQVMEMTAAVGGRRELTALTSGVEKRILVWMAERVPARVNADHLTLLGLVAMVGAGASYAATHVDLRFLHLVNLCLFLNWLGDSLDGTLARVRQKLRPRYGFYVDHLVDAVGALCVIVGLAFSGLMHPALAVSLLVVYYLLSIHIYLATHTQGVFKISYGVMGGTELRILLAVLNLAAMAAPTLTAGGFTLRLFDLAGACGLVGLLAVTVHAAAATTWDLYQQERV
jgi:archaetidylinositol phosphate synthase